MKTNKMIHLTILSSAIILYALLLDWQAFTELTKQEFQFDLLFPALLPFAVIAVSHFLFTNAFNLEKLPTSYNEQLGKYQSACIVQWAVLEGGVFLMLFLFSEFAVLGFIIIAFLAYRYPSDARMKNAFSES